MVAKLVVFFFGIATWQVLCLRECILCNKKTKSNIAGNGTKNFKDLGGFVHLQSWEDDSQEMGGKKPPTNFLIGYGCFQK